MNKRGQWAVESPKSERLSPQNDLYEFPQQNIHKIRKQTCFFRARLRREQSLWFHKEYLGNMSNFRGFTKTGLFFLQKKMRILSTKKWGFWVLKKWGIRKPKKKLWPTRQNAHRVRQNAHRVRRMPTGCARRPQGAPQCPQGAPQVLWKSREFPLRERPV